MNTKQTPALPWSFTREGIEVWIGDTRYCVNLTNQTAQRRDVRAGWRRVPEAWMKSARGLNLILCAEDRARMMEDENRAAALRAQHDGK